MDKNFKKNKSDLDTRIFKKQFAFVTSSGIMMIGCTLGGYFIGYKINWIGKFAGIIIGSIIGIIVFVGDIIFFINIEKKNK